MALNYAFVIVVSPIGGWDEIDDHCIVVWWAEQKSGYYYAQLPFVGETKVMSIFSSNPEFGFSQFCTFEQQREQTSLL